MFIRRFRISFGRSGFIRRFGIRSNGAIQSNAGIQSKVGKKCDVSFNRIRAWVADRPLLFGEGEKSVV